MPELRKGLKTDRIATGWRRQEKISKDDLSAVICAVSYLLLMGTSVESTVSLRKIKTRQKAVLYSKHLVGMIYEQSIPCYPH
jgi:hypothetical protein